MALTIGEVAQRAGIGRETIRFYEKEGLIEEPPRTESGYRQYSENAVARIRFIRRAKALGFSLKEVSGLLTLRLDPETSCADVKKRADSKIRDIQEKIRDLQKMKTALAELSAACSGKGSTSECPIIEALDSGEK